MQKTEQIIDKNLCNGKVPPLKKLIDANQEKEEEIKKYLRVNAGFSDSTVWRLTKNEKPTTPKLIILETMVKKLKLKTELENGNEQQ